MTKKILALALAGTTAFSVFASAMSVSAEAQESYTFGDFAAAYAAKSYTPVTIANTWTTDKYAREDYDNTVKAFKTLYDYVNGDTIYTNDDGDVLATPSSDDIKIRLRRKLLRPLWLTSMKHTQLLGVQLVILRLIQRTQRLLHF